MSRQRCLLSLRAGSLKHRSLWLTSLIYSGIAIACVELTSVTTSRFDKVGVPLPEQTDLWFSVYRTAPDDPDSFLVGSAPRLRLLLLDWISFSGLTRLLFPATHLVTLFLENIPDSRYISPEAMIACLSASTRLTERSFECKSSLMLHSLLPDEADIRP